MHELANKLQVRHDSLQVLMVIVISTMVKKGQLVATDELLVIIIVSSVRK